MKDLCSSELGQLGLERRLVHIHHGREQFVMKLSPEGCGKLGHLPVARHAIQPCHHQLLERRGDLLFAGSLEEGGFANHPAELFDEQGHAAGALVDLRNQRVRQGAVRVSADHFAHLAASQAVEGDARVLDRRKP